MTNSESPPRALRRRTWRDLPPSPPTAEHPVPPAAPAPGGADHVVLTQPPGPGPGPHAAPDPAPGRRTRRRAVAVSAAIAVAAAAAGAFALTRDDAGTGTRDRDGREPVQDVASALAPSVVHLQSTRGVGAGVVVDDGLVLTAAHVVHGITDVTVKGLDGEEHDGRVVGRATEQDLAVLAVEGAEALRPAPLATTPVEVGQQVVAIGSPFGLAQSVSAGVVSAVGRELDTPYGTLTGLIQTDTAINPGNSGGPLADLDGEVAGIATAIATSSGANDGVGFAVPIANAAALLDEVRAAGGVDAPTVPPDGGSDAGVLDDLLGGSGDPLEGLDELLGDELERLLDENLDELLRDLAPDAPLFVVPDEPGGGTSSAEGIVRIDAPPGHTVTATRVTSRADGNREIQEQQTVVDGPDGTSLLIAQRGDGVAERFASMEGQRVRLAGRDTRLVDDGATDRYAWMDGDVLVVLVVPDAVAAGDVEALASNTRAVG
ncbi:MAG: hypothetical protein KatS3mg009_1103 [Acidimicrobiia bacterium]|nr:MAG: hypothetical protein KatS3mg009_1103 [Acidimicrobiia bacterium]